MGASPEYSPLDEVDRAILQLLQRDTRNLTAVDIAERVGVSDGTVRNRIGNLEDEGIILGHVPMIDYEKAGYHFQTRIKCTAPIVEREDLAREALQVEGVVEVHEIMTGKRNVEVTAISPTRDHITETVVALTELGLDVESEELIRRHYLRPFDHFGTDLVPDEDDDEGRYQV